MDAGGCVYKRGMVGKKKKLEEKVQHEMKGTREKTFPEEAAMLVAAESCRSAPLQLK